VTDHSDADVDKQDYIFSPNVESTW